MQIMKSLWVFFLLTEIVGVIRQAKLAHFEIIREKFFVRNDGWHAQILHQSIRKQTSTDRLRTTGQFNMTMIVLFLAQFANLTVSELEREKEKKGFILLGYMTCNYLRN